MTIAIVEIIIASLQVTVNDYLNSHNYFTIYNKKMKKAVLLRLPHHSSTVSIILIRFY